MNGIAVRIEKGQNMANKIGVVGSINIDMTLTADRIPGRGETLLGSKVTYSAGGKGANQAYAAAKFGADTAMFGCVGDDENGRAMVENLKSAGVDVRHVETVKGVPTGLAVITVGDRDNTIIVIPGANNCVTCEYIDRIWPALSEMDAVLIQQEIPAQTVDYVIGLCRGKGITTVLNPAPARKINRETLDVVDYLTPNEHEAELLFPGEKLEDLLGKYSHKLVVTLGGKGAAASDKSGKILRVPAGKVAVCDTTGAGDTFNGILTALIAEEWPLEKAMLYANIGAGLSTEKMGAQSGIPTLEEIETCLKRRD